MNLNEKQAQGSLEKKNKTHIKLPLVERVYRKIKEDIFDFSLLPGDRFTETELATKLKVSRTPVREALFRLQHEGYLELRFRNGWLVKPIDFQVFEELYDIRILIETEAARYISLAPRDQREEALDGLVDRWLVAKNNRCADGDTVFGWDEAFHETIVATRGNRELTRIHHSVTEHIRIIRRLDFTQAERIQATYDEHGAILKALVDGEREGELAIELLHSHILKSKEEVNRITLSKFNTARKT
jgi:DNA-binding GntR family transcriptional regulator